MRNKYSKTNRIVRKAEQITEKDILRNTTEQREFEKISCIHNNSNIHVKTVSDKGRETSLLK